MTAKPDLLYMTPVVPALTGNGLAMRAGMVLELLAASHDVHLLIVPLYASLSPQVPEPLEKLCGGVAVVPPRPERRRWWGRGRKWGDRRFDVVHVFRLATAPFAMPYLHGWLHRPRRHLDLDDIESVTRRRLASLYRQNGDAASAWREESEAARQEVAENEAVRTFDRVYVCSPLDREKLRGRGGAEVCVLPNGVRIPEGVPERAAGGVFTFLFVGTLGYYPNEDGVRYLCSEVVPRIRALTDCPFEVNIAGTGASPSLQQAVNAAGVRLVGAVADLGPWYAQADAIVAPVRAGGGTRIKILEAFSYRRPVVATSIAMEGIQAEPGEHVLIGDTAAEFAEACACVIADGELRERLARNAFARLLDSYGMESLKKTYGKMDSVSSRGG